MQIKTANDKKTISMTKREWKSIGKKAGWEESSAHRIPLFSTSATLKAPGIDHDPREGSLAGNIEDMIYYAESAIPNMIGDIIGSEASVYTAEIKPVGEPRIAENNEVDEMGQSKSYDLAQDVEMTVFAKLLNEQQIREMISKKNWLELGE